MNKLNKFTSAVSRVLEIIHWAAILGALVMLILSFAAQGVVSDLLNGLEPTISVYGFECTVLDAGGAVNFAALRLLCVAGLFLFGLMAMVFRNIHLIFKTSAGKTWFSKGETPFQKDVVRMVREIGIFSIAIPIIGLIFSGIARVVTGVDGMEMSVDLGGFVTGIVVLCLSQIFAYGMSLQRDVDGLL